MFVIDRKNWRSFYPRTYVIFVQELTSFLSKNWHSFCPRTDVTFLFTTPPLHWMLDGNISIPWILNERQQHEASVSMRAFQGLASGLEGRQEELEQRDEAGSILFSLFYHIYINLDHYSNFFCISVTSRVYIVYDVLKYTSTFFVISCTCIYYLKLEKKSIGVHTNHCVTLPQYTMNS